MRATSAAAAVAAAPLVVVVAACTAAGAAAAAAATANAAAFVPPKTSRAVLPAGPDRRTFPSSATVPPAAAAADDDDLGPADPIGGGGGDDEVGFSLYGSSSGFNSGYSTTSTLTSTGGYSRSLVRSGPAKRRLERRVRRRKALNRLLNEERERELEMAEDGYGEMFRRKKRNNLASSAVRSVLKFGRDALFPSYAKRPGTLIMIRHGESEWNANKTFTGWADPDLSSQGYREVEHAARLLLEGGYKIDVVFTSRLKRAIRSTWMLLQELNEVYLPVFKSWRLNERMYGGLTGLSKTETAERLGHELVQAWRGSLRSRPPPVRTSDPRWPGRDRRYADLSASQIPRTESLSDCMDRTAPLWEDKISHELRMGRNVLVVAHANTLRGLVKIIDGIGDDEIQDVAIPTGIPIIYRFEHSKDLDPVPPDRESGGGVQQVHMKGLFLEKPGVLKEALLREREWCAAVPGYEYTMGRHKRPMAPLERSLYKLEAERELGSWAGQFIDRAASEREDEEEEDDDGNDGRGKFIVIDEDKAWDDGLHALEGGEIFDPDYPEFRQRAAPPRDGDAEAENREAGRTVVEVGSDGGGGGDGYDDLDSADDPGLEDEEAEPTTTPNVMGVPCMKSVPAESISPGGVPIRKDAVIVIIRHGKTEHNKLGLFTGWEDAPLAEEGVDEARDAGRLLKLHGFEFDIVYTSWLSRAIETAWYVMDELDCLWLPIIKSWRLNERMYGDLTGLSKKMVAQRHGEEQFKAWRRGFKVRPPPVSSFSTNYPGNDIRYQKYVNDLRFSLSESVIRSIEGGRPELHRDLPKSESLKDCMDRTVPYFTHQIVPEAINEGRRVLISSSENAIRGLLMHLCDIPEEEITGLEIPNGLPIIFDVKSKCVKLLDDGSGEDPLKKYNFGAAGSYLFRPCLNEDGSPDEECDIAYMSDAAANGGRRTTSLSEEERRTLETIVNGGYATGGSGSGSGSGEPSKAEVA